VAQTGDHSVRQRSRRICSRGRGAQGGRYLPKRLVNAPRSVGSGRLRQRRRRVQGATRCRTPKGQSAGGPRGGAVCLVLPRCANAERAAGAEHPPS
jgi:hypothetical protein